MGSDKTNTKEGETDKRLYLDYAASMPVREEIRLLVPELLEHSANPSSIHAEGVLERASIERARKQTAQILGALPEEIHFTSGSTEALNIAIRGVVKKTRETFQSPHIITSKIEHPAILETVRALEKEGATVDYLVPNRSGVVEAQEIRSALRAETVLLALSLVNSEIGTVAPIDAYARELRLFRKNVTGQKLPLFLIDATQAPLYFKLNVHKMSADLLVLDGGKIGGLKGSGILYAKRDAGLSPTLYGGGQEGGLRPGTQNSLGIVTFAKALELSQSEVESNREAVQGVVERFLERLRKEIPRATLNGEGEDRAPHIVSICFPGVDAEWLVLTLDAAGIAVSRGSACKSGKGNESEVVRVINPDCKESSVRFSFSPTVTRENVDKVVDVLRHSIASSASFS